MKLRDWCEHWRGVNGDWVWTVVFSIQCGSRRENESAGRAKKTKVTDDPCWWHFKPKLMTLQTKTDGTSNWSHHLRWWHFKWMRPRTQMTLKTEVITHGWWQFDGILLRILPLSLCFQHHQHLSSPFCLPRSRSQKYPMICLYEFYKQQPLIWSFFYRRGQLCVSCSCLHSWSYQGAVALMVGLFLNYAIFIGCWTINENGVV